VYSGAQHRAHLSTLSPLISCRSSIRSGRDIRLSGRPRSAPRSFFVSTSIPVAETRWSANSAVFTLTVCAAASAAAVASRVATAVASEAFWAASLALIVAFLVFSSVSRWRPAAVFLQAVEKSASPAAHTHTDSRRVRAFIDDLHLVSGASDVPAVKRSRSVLLTVSYRRAAKRRAVVALAPWRPNCTVYE
jgi:hypothetical protein